MKFGRNKKSTVRNTSAVDLFRQCEQVYAANWGLVKPDHDGCAAAALNLVSPDGRSTYTLVIHDDPERYYGLFPLGKYAGHGSFIDPDGGFIQSGQITRADAEQVIATFTPATPAS